MKLISYMIWVVVAPFVLSYLGIKVFKKRFCIIVTIETIVILFLTLLGVIGNYPTGNIQNQLSLYFGNRTNDFYLKYIPLIISTIIFHGILKKTNLFEKQRKRCRF